MSCAERASQLKGDRYTSTSIRLQGTPQLRVGRSAKKRICFKDGHGSCFRTNIVKPPSEEEKVVAAPKKKEIESSKWADKYKPAPAPAALNLSGLPGIEPTSRRLELEGQKTERTERCLFYSPTAEIMDDVRRNRLRATLSVIPPETRSESAPRAARPKASMMVNSDGQLLYFDLESAAGPHGGMAYKTRGVEGGV